MAADTLGDYARVFEEEYLAIVDEMLDELGGDAASAGLKAYLRRDEVRSVHEGYFSIDKKTKMQVDPTSVEARKIRVNRQMSTHTI